MTHKRQKVLFSVFCFFFFLYLFSFFIAYCMIHSFYKKLMYKKLGLRCLKTQGASTAAITFPTKFSYIENQGKMQRIF